MYMFAKTARQFSVTLLRPSLERAELFALPYQDSFIRGFSTNYPLSEFPINSFFLFLRRHLGSPSQTVFNNRK